MLCHAQSLQLQFRATCGRLSSRAHHQSFRNNRRVSIIILLYIYVRVSYIVLLYIGARPLLQQNSNACPSTEKHIKSRRCETTILWRHNLFSKLNSTCTYIYVQQYDIITLYTYKHYTTTRYLFVLYVIRLSQHNRTVR